MDELKDHLEFKLTTDNLALKEKTFENYDILFIHEDYFKNDISEKNALALKSDKIKILAFYSKTNLIGFNDSLSLPTSVKDINEIIKNSIIKKNFNNNSKISINEYVLDKNEKKLFQNNNFVILTEKEIQLLELLIGNSFPLSKNRILHNVWKYAADVDTHTVETHIYRLRKKIKLKFADENFILNKKDGYLL